MSSNQILPDSEEVQSKQPEAYSPHKLPQYRRQQQLKKTALAPLAELSAGSMSDEALSNHGSGGASAMDESCSSLSAATIGTDSAAASTESTTHSMSAMVSSDSSSAGPLRKRELTPDSDGSGGTTKSSESPTKDSVSIDETKKSRPFSASQTSDSQYSSSQSVATLVKSREYTDDAESEAEPETELSRAAYGSVRSGSSDTFFDDYRETLRDDNSGSVTGSSTPTSASPARRRRMKDTLKHRISSSDPTTAIRQASASRAGSATETEPPARLALTQQTNSRLSDDEGGQIDDSHEAEEKAASVVSDDPPVAQDASLSAEMKSGLAVPPKPMIASRKSVESSERGVVVTTESANSTPVEGPIGDGLFVSDSLTPMYASFDRLTMTSSASLARGSSSSSSSEEPETSAEPPPLAVDKRMVALKMIAQSAEPTSDSSGDSATPVPSPSTAQATAELDLAAAVSVAEKEDSPAQDEGSLRDSSSALTAKPISKLEVPPPDAKTSRLPPSPGRSNTTEGLSASAAGRSPRPKQGVGSPPGSPALSEPATTPVMADWRHYVPLGNQLKSPNRGHDMYEKKFKKIGSGVFARVYRTTRKSDGSMVAVKVFVRTNIQAEIAFSNECKLLSTVSHPNLIQLSVEPNYYNGFVDHKYYYLELELCLGGDLWTYMVKSDRVSESEARIICVQMLDVLNELSRNNFAHRDLKPENIVLLSPGSTRNIRVIDFGESLQIEPGRRYADGVGTLVYFAPERWGRPTGEQLLKSDVWSVGLITWELIAGQRYYAGLSEYALCREIRSEPLFIPDYMHITAECRDFFQQLLEKDPNRRPSSQEAFRHPWLWGRSMKEDLSHSGGHSHRHKKRASSVPTPPLKEDVETTDARLPLASGVEEKKHVSIGLSDTVSSLDSHIRRGSIIIPPKEADTERLESDASGISAPGGKKTESTGSLPLSPRSMSRSHASPYADSSGQVSSPNKSKRAPSDSFSFLVESESTKSRYHSYSYEAEY